MAITLADALKQLNIAVAPDDTSELELFVDAANEWVAERVTTTDPAPVKLATLFLLDHMWETQRGAAGTPLDSDEATYSFGFAIPNRVLELLDPWLKEGQGSKPAAPSGSFPAAVAWPDPVEWPT